MCVDYGLINVVVERVGAEVVECACVIELPELKVCSAANVSEF